MQVGNFLTPDMTGSFKSAKTCTVVLEIFLYSPFTCRKLYFHSRGHNNSIISIWIDIELKICILITQTSNAFSEAKVEDY